MREKYSQGPLGKSDLSGLESLKGVAGDKLTKGIVLYTGDQPMVLGECAYALPINSL